MVEEMRIFVEKELFDEVQRPRNRRVVGCKWVFKEKLGSDGQIEKYKARLVARGFTQVPGVDFTETFAPVTKFTSICTLLALAAIYDLKIHQMDVKSAFLNGELDEEIFMEPPPGFPAPKNMVWCLRKSLYSLKQASREWYKAIRAEFEALGFTQSHSDHSVFHKYEDGHLVIIAIYVDNMLLLSENLAAITKSKTELAAHYEMADMGEAHWILNMEIIWDCTDQTIELSQEQFIEDILEHQGMANCRPVSTPMA
ncbi:hypothetical protein NLI96_g12655 [Meripilus lineatus]|uniref:Reverse transcriptase Ty1/copia-type domain-containing protein n=1 Tax=Meripilus lineatus TaxID=2056292 RepID=A0AAD5UU63_9APHY|nr:hypothetical protein NLI96_g12655 [Physisporinus lineatus]